MALRQHLSPMREIALPPGISAIGDFRDVPAAVMSRMRAAAIRPPLQKIGPENRADAGDRQRATAEAQAGRDPSSPIHPPMLMHAVPCRLHPVPSMDSPSMNPDKLDSLDWRVLRPSGFNAHTGPMYFASAGENEWFVTLELDERHMNHGGFCHGGVLLTLADTSMGTAAFEAAGKRFCATVGLQSHFIAMAKRGQTLIAHARLDRMAGGLAFMQAELHAGGRLCMRASGIWKVLARERALPDPNPVPDSGADAGADDARSSGRNR